MEIKKITPKPRQMLYGDNIKKPGKIRVAAYARVSTELDEQESSFKNQQDHFMKLADENADQWKFVGLYSDDGISGKFAESRNGFTNLINDCDAGKIDKIITKSVSRFARNTLECIAIVRKLKEKGIAIYFEKENIDTLAENSEFILTLMASLAEEESRSISRNVKWTIKKKFEAGEVILCTTTFLGYDKDENKNLVINENQAVIVRRIYKEFIEGKSPAKIAKDLKADKIPSACGGVSWTSSTIRRLIQNEKYCGDVILQKTFKPDFLSKERIKNEGQADMYFIRDHHPAIINKEDWEYAQMELNRRCIKPKSTHEGIRDYTSEKSEFSGIIYCGNCGYVYESHKQYHGGSKKYTMTNLCSSHRNHPKMCKSKPIRTTDMEALFVRSMNHLIDKKEDSFEKLKNLKEEIISSGSETKLMENKFSITSYEAEMEKIAEMPRDKAKKFEQRANELRYKVGCLEDENTNLTFKIHCEKFRLQKICELEDFIKKGKKLSKFNAQQMRNTVYTIKIEPGQKAAQVKFECGLEVRELILRKVKDLTIDKT